MRDNLNKVIARRNWMIGALILIVAISLFALLVRLFENGTLWDFTTTFYRSANYLARGENVYLSTYPHADNDRQYPPYNPIWILYFAVPLSVYPLHVAEALRFGIDVAAVPLLAYLCARWARLSNARSIALLIIAPWHLPMIYDGQWSAFTLLGALLCYIGARRANASAMAVGLWLAAIKPNITTLVILATMLYALRNRMFIKTMLVLIGLIAISSLAQPMWLFDLLGLYISRFTHPDPTAYPTLILPGYPWSQLILMMAGTAFLLIYMRRSKEMRPALWLWAVLVCVSLVSALHSFTYDWLMLMLPIAWLLRDRRATVLVGALYVYPFLWALVPSIQPIGLLSPVFIPSALLIAALIWRVPPLRQATILNHT